MSTYLSNSSSSPLRPTTSATHAFFLNQVYDSRRRSWNSENPWVHLQSLWYYGEMGGVAESKGKQPVVSGG